MCRHFFLDCQLIPTQGAQVPSFPLVIQTIPPSPVERHWAELWTSYSPRTDRFASKDGKDVRRKPQLVGQRSSYRGACLRGQASCCFVDYQLPRSRQNDGVDQNLNYRGRVLRCCYPEVLRTSERRSRHLWCGTKSRMHRVEKTA